MAIITPGICRHPQDSCGKRRKVKCASYCTAHLPLAFRTNSRELIQPHNDAGVTTAEHVRTVQSSKGKKQLRGRNAHSMVLVLLLAFLLCGTLTAATVDVKNKLQYVFLTTSSGDVNQQCWPKHRL